MDSFDVECGGRKWTVSKATGAARDALEKFVLQAAWAEVDALREVLPGAFPELKADFIRMVGAKEYKAGGKGWQASVGGPDSNTLFLASLLSVRHPQVTPADARELIAGSPDSVEVALAALVPGFFDFLSADPATPPELRRGFAAGAETARARLAARQTQTAS